MKFFVQSEWRKSPTTRHTLSANFAEHMHPHKQISGGDRDVIEN